MAPSPPFRVAGSISTGTTRSYESLVDEATTGELVLRVPLWVNLGWMTLWLAPASLAFFINPLPLDATEVALCAISGLGVISVALSCHPKASYVSLTARGMTVVNFFRSYSFAWNDVSNIGITNVQNRTLVGFDRISATAANPFLAALAVKMAGFQCLLYRTYGLPVRTLATLMVDLRQRALERESG